MAEETFTKEQTRQLARKSFLLGVDWVLKTLTQHQDIWNLDDHDAKVLRKKAETVIGTYVPEAKEG